MLQEWRAAGHTVHQFHAFNDTAYRRKRNWPGRLWLRFVTYALFPLRAWIKLCSSGISGDRIRVVITSPFYLPWLASFTPPTGPRVTIVNDLFPDALVHAGLLAPHGRAANWIAGLTRRDFARSDASVFLGRHLMAHAERSYGPTKLGRVIPVGTDATFVSTQAPALAPDQGRTLDILYSGTMGHMHDVMTFVHAIRSSVPPDLSFTFHSNGAGYRLLRRELAAAGKLGPAGNVHLKNSLTDNAWREALNHHPIGLVTLKAGAEHVSMPSKAYSALAAGQAILAICPVGSDLADLIRTHDCGWVVEPGQSEELRDLLVRLAGNRAEVRAKQLRAFEAGHSQYDMSVISRQYLQLFAELLGTPHSSKGDRLAAE